MTKKELINRATVKKFITQESAAYHAILGAEVVAHPKHKEAYAIMKNGKYLSDAGFFDIYA